MSSRVIDDEVLVKVLQRIDELFDFDEYDLNDPAFVESLSEVDRLMIRVPRGKSFSSETVRQLGMLLDSTNNLQVLNIDNQRGDAVDASSIFSHLSPSIKSIVIRNLVFESGIEQNDVDRLQNIEYVRFEDCALSELPIFDSLVSLTNVSSISKEELIRYGLEHNLYVTDDAEVQGVLAALKKGAPISLDLFKKYSNFFENCDCNICISIESVAELSVQDVANLREEYSNIKAIHIENGCYSYEPSKEFSGYSLDEYIGVRTEIDNIIAQVEIPMQDDRDREKKIFAQVYKILGETISYDHFAISEKGKQDEMLAYSCRNLKNGLCGVEREGKSEKLTVCAGYTDILRNVLSCFGIESHYVKSESEPDLEFKNGAYVEKTDEKGNVIYRNGTTDPKGHAYTMVVLDGEEFYSDLTWDASYIKSKRFPMPEFLKSASDFEKSHKKVGFNIPSNSKANRSVTMEEQCELFNSTVNIGLEQIQDMINEGYLSGFVSMYIDAVKAGRENITSEEVINAMNYIKQIEDHLLNRGNQISNIGIKIGEDKRFVFETSDQKELARLKKEIRKRREKDGDSFGEF